MTGYTKHHEMSRQSSGKASAMLERPNFRLVTWSVPTLCGPLNMTLFLKKHLLDTKVALQGFWIAVSAINDDLIFAFGVPLKQAQGPLLSFSKWLSSGGARRACLIGDSAKRRRHNPEYSVMQRAQPTHSFKQATKACYQFVAYKRQLHILQHTFQCRRDTLGKSARSGWQVGTFTHSSYWQICAHGI